MSKHQQAREAHVIFRARPGCWDVEKNRLGEPEVSITEERRIEILRANRAAAKTHNIKVMYLREGENL